MKRYIFLLSGSLLCTVFPHAVQAYIGPGAGLSAIGTFLAVIGGLLLLIVGFVWYPVKRMLRARKERNKHVETDQSDTDT